MLQEAWTAGLLNGLVVTNGYDGLLRRQSLQLLQSGTVKAQTAYGYDGASRLQSVSDGTNGVTYAYVANSPLVGSVVLNDGTNPDIVKSSAGKRYVPPASESYAYDGDGNRTNDGHWTYVWDAENRLVQMETKSSAVSAGIPKEKLEYNYDYRSRRIGKKSYSGWNGSSYTSTSEKRFVYDGWNLIAEFSVPSGLLLDKSYVWGLDLSLGLRGAGGVGGLVSLTETGGNTSQFYAYDGNGNVVGLVDNSTGNETARYEYGPFGELIRSTGSLADINPFRFSTKYQDDESGLLYYGYRYYEPEAGRWLSRDPIREAGGVSLYGFVGNDSLNWVDYLGLAITSSRRSPHHTFEGPAEYLWGDTFFEWALASVYNTLPMVINTVNAPIEGFGFCYEKGADVVSHGAGTVTAPLTGDGGEFAQKGIYNTLMILPWLDMMSPSKGAAPSEFRVVPEPKVVEAPAPPKRQMMNPVQQAQAGPRPRPKPTEAEILVGREPVGHTPPIEIQKGWKPYDINKRAYHDGCEKVAEAIQKIIGGDVKRIIAHPLEGLKEPYLGPYRGASPNWKFHEVVVKDGRVYDAFTGSEGATIDEFKALFEYADDLNFGF